MQHGTSIANTTYITFGKVMDAVDNVSASTKQISLNLQQQMMAMEQTLVSMNSLESGAKETALGITQVKIGIGLLNTVARRLKEMM